MRNLQQVCLHGFIMRDTFSKSPVIMCEQIKQKK